MNDAEGYQIIRQLGAGLAGPVFLAETQFGRSAVRLYQPPPGVIDEELGRQAFVEGAKRASGLNQPRIVRVLEVIDEGGQVYEVMEYIPHGTLRDSLAGEGPSPEHSNRILRHAAVTLHYAHQNGVTHGDLKPSSIFLLPGQSIKISDFAVSPLASLALDKVPIEWRHAYLAPEHFYGREKLGPLADQYSLAAIAYHIYTGRLPTRGADGAGSHLAPPSAVRPDLPAAVDEVFAKALAMDPTYRYSSCLEFMDVLEGALTRKNTAAPVAPIVAAQRNRILLAGAALVVLLAAGLAFFLAGRKPAGPVPEAHKNPPVATAETHQPPPRPPIEKAVEHKPAQTNGPDLPPHTDARVQPHVVPPLIKQRTVPNPVVPTVAAADPAPDTPAYAIEVYSRNKRIEPGMSFSEKDPELGELAQGDISARVVARSAGRRGKMTIDWFVNEVYYDSKVVAPGGRVEYGNEPTIGTYRAVLKLDAKKVDQFIFRITK